MNPVFDVRAFGAAGNGSANDTAPIQRAVDAAAAAGGGEVLLPPGTYLSGTVFLRSRVDFHLAEGALLKASPDPADYNPANAFPQNWASPRSGDNQGGGHLLVGVGVSEVLLRGPGKVDGNAPAFLRMPDGSHPPSKADIPWRPGQMVLLAECRGVTIRDIELADAPYWSCFLHGCEDVAVERVRIHTIRDPHTYNGDGLDIDCCRRVRVRGCDISTADDSLTLRADPARLLHPGDCADVTVEDCAFSSDCNAIRLGVGNGTIRDCRFARIRIRDTRYAVNAVGAWSRPERGVDIRRVGFEDIDIEARAFCKFYYKFATGSVFEDIAFRRVRGTVREPSVFDDSPERPFLRLRFDDVRLDGETSPRAAAGVRSVDVPVGAAIQPAIDGMAAAGGGRVRLAAGVHDSGGTLYLQSGVELNIPDGAVLRGPDTPDAYDDVADPRIGIAPEGSRKVFLACLDGCDVAITGGGVIDGRGVAFYDSDVPPGTRHFAKPSAPRTRMLQFFRCRGVRLEGVTLRDSPGWTCWFRRCEDVAVRGVSVLGDQRMINNDGLDFDGCRRVRVERCRLRTGDDCIVMRAIPDRDGNSALCEDLSVSDCDLDSACQGVRLGCPSDGLIRHARFERLRIRGHNGILSYHPYRYLVRGTRGGSGMEDIVFESCDIDVEGSPLFFAVDPAVELASFGNVTLRNVRAKGGAPVVLKGNASTPLAGMRLENVSLDIAAPVPVETACVEDLVLSGVSVVSGRPEPPPFEWDGRSDSWEADK